MNKEKKTVATVGPVLKRGLLDMEEAQKRREGQTSVVCYADDLDEFWDRLPYDEIGGGG